jgi:hypothetical protein
LTPHELFKQLRQRHGALSAQALAAVCGIEIQHASWQVAAGRVVFFAECTRHPLRITLNDAAIKRLTAHVAVPSDQPWFTRQAITEVIVAHELFHLLTPPPSGWDSSTEQENQAHAFAQRWTGLPFHPTRYEQILWDTF